MTWQQIGQNQGRDVTPSLGRAINRNVSPAPPLHPYRSAPGRHGSGPLSDIGRLCAGGLHGQERYGLAGAEVTGGEEELQ